MLAALTALLLCQLAGEAIVRAVTLPVPGPVVGMILLFVLMLARAPLPKETGDTANGLLKHLSLLFVPAGVGVVQEIGRLGDTGLRLIAVVVLGTVIALTVTALTFAGVARLLGSDDLAPKNNKAGDA
jgi:putative effector of murein hydrolase LrgA (UPF0299 family)